MSRVNIFLEADLLQVPYQPKRRGSPRPATPNVPPISASPSPPHFPVSTQVRYCRYSRFHRRFCPPLSLDGQLLRRFMFYYQTTLFPKLQAGSDRRAGCGRKVPSGDSRPAGSWILSTSQKASLTLGLPASRSRVAARGHAQARPRARSAGRRQGHGHNGD
jgi:hypothetical protein